MLNEYLTVKYEPIAKEFNIFYNSMREKCPDKHIYKGSKKFRTWVRNQIVQYVGNWQDEKHLDVIEQESMDLDAIEQEVMDLDAIEQEVIFCK